MIQELTQVELYNIIEELLDWEAFEVEILADGEVLFPYLMNDATEYFVRLEGCEIQGSWCGDKKEVQSVSFETGVADEYAGGLLISQNNGNLHIRYRRALKEMHCYQYHRIGHNWRREKDHLRIRRLVNLLCVLHDKCSYLGEAASTEAERKLSLLIEFQPLCFWTPINDSIEDWYPETMEGIYAMEDLAQEAKDQTYLELLKKYRLFLENFDESQSGRRMKKQLFKKQEMQVHLQEALTAPEHRGIIDLLEKKIEEASAFWPPRRYKEETEEEISRLRKEKEEEYRNRGYTGQYPFMEKKTEETGEAERILFVEEQPFMELEWSDYSFRIYKIGYASAIDTGKLSQ